MCAFKTSAATTKLQLNQYHLVQYEAILNQTMAQLDRDLLLAITAGNKTAQTLREFLDQYPQQLMDVSDTAARLRTLELRFPSIADAWHDHRVSPDLFALLNFTLPCAPDCPATSLSPARCGHDAAQRKIILYFTGDIIDRRELLLTADPFTFDEHQRCETRYAGDRHVLYNRDANSNCSVRILQDTGLALPTSHPCNGHPPTVRWDARLSQKPPHWAFMSSASSSTCSSIFTLTTYHWKTAASPAPCTSSNPRRNSSRSENHS